MEKNPTGCYRSPHTGRLTVRKRINGKLTYLGTYLNRETAERAYAEGEQVKTGKTTLAPNDLTEKERRAIHQLVECLLGSRENPRAFVCNDNVAHSFASAHIPELGGVKITLEIE